MNQATQEVKKTGMSGGSQMRITPDERDLIKRTYKGNDAALLILRKIFLPEVDPKAPIGQVIDLWMTLKSDVSMEQQLINLAARNLMIAHTDQMLMQLKLIAESTEVEAINQEKNSTK